jgi:hypothetical protein
MKHIWIIYDGRAELGDTDDASIIECVTSRRSLRDALYHCYGHDGVLFEYDDNGVNEVLTNERLIGPLRLGRKTLLDLVSA